MSNSLKELNLNDHKNWIISDLILKQAKNSQNLILLNSLTMKMDL